MWKEQLEGPRGRGLRFLMGVRDLALIQLVPRPALLHSKLTLLRYCHLLAIAQQSRPNGQPIADDEACNYDLHLLLMSHVQDRVERLPHHIDVSEARGLKC